MNIYISLNVYKSRLVYECVLANILVHFSADFCLNVCVYMYECECIYV